MTLTEELLVVAKKKTTGYKYNRSRTYHNDTDGGASCCSKKENHGIQVQSLQDLSRG
jgi:hypothetical protein